MELVLIFKLAEEWYGLEVDDLQEIVEAPELNYVPRGPGWLIGAINFHGSIVPVIDLADYLHLGHDTYGGKVLVLPTEEYSLALGVSEVFRIVPLDPDALLPYQAEGQDNTHVRVLYSYQEKMVNMLDLPGLLTALGKNS